MSGVTLVVVITLLVITVVVVLATVRVMVTHLRSLSQALATVRRNVEPELERLRVATEVTRGELERVSDANDALHAQRTGQRRTRERRPPVD